MNNIVFEKFLKEQVLMQRELFLENVSLTESQKYNKVVSILLENETLNEEFMDKLKSLVGGGVEKVKAFLARRLVSSLGVSRKSPLHEPITNVLMDLNIKDIQGIFKGNSSTQKRFSRTAAMVTIMYLQRDASGALFGLSENTFLGGPLSDAVKSVFNSEEFMDLVFNSYQRALTDTSSPVHTSGLGDEDTDDDGLANAEEEALGTDPTAKDDNESLKDLINDEPVDEPLPTDTEGEYGDLGPPEDTGEELEGDLSGWDSRVEDWMIGWYHPKEPDEFIKSRLFSREEAKETLQDWSDKNPDLRFWVLLASDENDTWKPPEEHPAWNEGDAPEEETEAEVEIEDEEEAVADEGLTSKQKKEQMKEFVGNFMGGRWMLRNEAGKLVRVITGKGKPEFIDPIYAEFIAAATEDKKLEVLNTNKFLNDTGYHFIKTLNSATPEQEVEDAIRTGDKERIAGAGAAATERDDVSQEDKESAARAASDAIEDIPSSEENAEPVAEEEVVDVGEPEVSGSEVPDDIRKEYKRLVSALDRGNLSDKEEKKVEKRLNDLEEKYPGIDEEPSAEAEAVPGTEAAAEEAKANAEVEETEAEAAEMAAEENPEDATARAAAETEREEADEAAMDAEVAGGAEVGEEPEAAEEPEEGEYESVYDPETKKVTKVPKKSRFTQVNVELYDDKTVVLTDKSARGKIKRSSLGEGMLTELEWAGTASKGVGKRKFDRKGVSVVELPPVSTEKFGTVNWGLASQEQKNILRDEIISLLKDRAETDPEIVVDFDLGTSEETGEPNLRIMSQSQPGGARRWSGVFDHRTPATPELPEALKSLYNKLVRNYIKTTTDKKTNIVAGTFNYKAAEKKYGKGIRAMSGKKVKELADVMDVEYSEVDLEDYMADIVKGILIKGGALAPEEVKAPEKKPVSATPEPSGNEMEDLESGFEASLKSEEEEELEETFKISGDLLRKLLA